MADQMLFPDTVEEFMEQYKIVDTEQIYTNGTEMVPIFRMKQWFEHKLEHKTGKWILCDEQREEDIDNGNYRYLCSNCNYADIHAKIVKVPFCWHCGAKMEGEQP